MSANSESEPPSLASFVFGALLVVVCGVWYFHDKNESDAKTEACLDRRGTIVVESNVFRVTVFKECVLPDGQRTTKP